MADAKATALTPLVVAEDGDILYIVDDPGGTPVSKKITLGNLRSSMNPLDVYVPVSGDTTGVADVAAIQAALVKNGRVRLGPGTYYIGDSLTVTSTGAGRNENCILEGAGLSTILQGTEALAAADKPIIKLSAASTSPIQLDFRLANITLDGGKYCLEGDTNTSYVLCDNVRFRDSTSHGVYLHNGAWIYDFKNCFFLSNGADGINSVTSATDQNGNAMHLTNCQFASTTGHGIDWAASGLSVFGCLFEQCGDSAIQITCPNASASGVAIHGSYFETNGTAHIEMIGTTGKAISGVDIAGNYMVQNSTDPCILVSGDYDTVRDVVIHKSNGMSTSGTYTVNVGAAFNRGVIWQSGLESLYNIDYKTRNEFSRRQLETRVRTVRCPVDASAGGTAQTTALITIPDGGIIHNIVAHAEVAFNSSGTKTVDVGVAGNINKYIDSTDFTPGTIDSLAYMIGGTNNDQKTMEFCTGATAIIATWTNAAAATAGRTVVYVTYSEAIA